MHLVAICFIINKNEGDVMPNYDFHKLLEPFEFQNLVRDILQVREHCTFESFSPGKDEGVDLRKTVDDNTIIIQIKRYKNDFKALYDSLKRYEVEKVKRLKPNRYIIVTSVSLGKTQKDKLAVLFSGYIKSTEDILSGEDLNNLLGQKEYHFIELNYPKLWYQSGNVFFNQMKDLMHSNLYEETRNEYENIKEMMSYYIPVPYFQEIIENIINKHYLLISGKAGMGKTSLARAIVAYFIKKEGYQFIFARNVRDVNSVYKEKQKQIFFFDDFWGSSIYDLHYDFNEERSLKTLIEKIEKSSNKILILTTRDYVLKYGLLKNLDLEDTLTKQQYILDINKYSLKLRLDILLNINFLNILLKVLIILMNFYLNFIKGKRKKQNFYYFFY